MNTYQALDLVLYFAQEYLNSNYAQSFYSKEDHERFNVALNKVVEVQQKYQE